MRLLLILALLAASVGLAPPAAAQTDHRMAQHHSHAMHGDHRRGGHEGDHDTGKAAALAHVCPGCALLGQPDMADAGMLPAALPRLPANPPLPRSFDANPIPPPPRFA